jgi:hypothetical protein
VLLHVLLSQQSREVLHISPCDLQEPVAAPFPAAPPTPTAPPAPVLVAPLPPDATGAPATPPGAPEKPTPPVPPDGLLVVPQPVNVPPRARTDNQAARVFDMTGGESLEHRLLLTPGKTATDTDT